LDGGRRSNRKRLTVDRQQVSENSSLMSTEDAMSERVRFDDNVSFIDNVPGTLTLTTTTSQQEQTIVENSQQLNETSPPPTVGNSNKKIKSKKSDSKFSFDWIRFKRRNKEDK